MKLLRSKSHCRWCLRSKAAILILIWNFLLAICLQSYFDPTFYLNLLRTQADVYGNGITYGIIALLLLFYPLAGCLADTRWGRYKTVNSLYFVFWSFVVILLLGGLLSAGIYVITDTAAKVLPENLFLTVPTTSIATYDCCFPVVGDILCHRYCHGLCSLPYYLQFCGIQCQCDSIWDRPTSRCSNR